MRQSFDIDPVLEGGDGTRHRPSPNLQQIGAPGNQRLLAEPDHICRELVDAFWRIVRIGEKIAAGNVDLTVESESDRVPFGRASERAIEGDDLPDPRGLARAR